MSKRERRTTTVEIREADNGSINGLAAPYSTLSLDLGGWKERLIPGCFDKALREHQDVCALWNHNPDYVLGRTSSGTLTLRDTAKGLAFEVRLGSQHYAQDLRESIRRGDVSECSFGFVVGDTRWVKEGRDEIREVLSIDVLLDVSPVTRAAYGSATHCDARYYFPDGMDAECRKRYDGEECNGIYRAAWEDSDFVEWARLKLRLARIEDER